MRSKSAETTLHPTFHPPFQPATFSWGYRNPPPQPVLPPAPEPVPPRTIHMYVRLWVSKGGFCTMKWETWEANQQTYPSRHSLPSPLLRFSFLADRILIQPSPKNYSLRPNIPPNISKEPLRPENRKSVIKDWRVLFQRNILASWRT